MINPKFLLASIDDWQKFAKEITNKSNFNNIEKSEIILKCENCLLSEVFINYK